MKTAIMPRFGVTTIDSATAQTANSRLAATIYAFDVPLHATNPYTVTAGDGLAGTRVVWNFDQRDTAGNSPAEIAHRWTDEAWMHANPAHPLTICRRAFEWFDKFKQALKTGVGPGPPKQPAIDVTNTRQAAVLAALDHPWIGWHPRPVVTTWCFPQAAASDAALWDDRTLYDRLPDASISYARAAILGHEAMVKAIKSVQFARVEHRGRAAMIGRDIPQDKLDQLEKILYRK